MELVIITGHSSGLGHALASSALAAGRSVLGASRRSLKNGDRRLRECPVDLSASHEWEAQLSSALGDWRTKAWDRIVLINNAGTIFPVAPVASLPAAELSAAYALNVIAPLRCSRWLLQQFPDRRQSLQFVFIGSGAAQSAYAGWSVYCSCKAAVFMQAQVLATEMELEGRAAKVLSYAPGVLDTPMQRELRAILASESFPMLERFNDLHQKGELIDPLASASELWNLLDEKNAFLTEKTFTHYRYGNEQLRK